MKVACFIFYFKALQNNNTIYFSICRPSAETTHSICPLKLSVSNMDQTLKSIGLRLGDEGGHNSLLQNRRKLSLHQAWVFFGGLRGCCKCSFISRKAGTKMSSMYTFVLTLTLCFTKIRGNFQGFDTAAQTMTDADFWRQ